MSYIAGFSHGHLDYMDNKILTCFMNLNRLNCFFRQLCDVELILPFWDFHILRIFFKWQVTDKSQISIPRSRLSYEQFSAFLANIKELNAQKQSREVSITTSVSH